MKIREFGVETWMNRYETRCRHNLAETCIDSLTVGELLTLAGRSPDDMLRELTTMKLTYGAIEGSVRLRRAIASLYEHQTVDQVTVTHGAIGANALVYETLVSPGDRVVSVLPNYQQHYSIPESYGANVQPVWLRKARRFALDLAEVDRLATDGTRLIVCTNPNNPTGALLDRAQLDELVAIARRAGAWLLCDEVYRGTDEEGSGYTASVADLYERGISTGSMSKTYSLAGLRLGWIVAPPELIAAVSTHRDYNTISVGMLDDSIAALALEHRDAILRRNHAILRGNRARLKAWVEAEPSITYVPPRSGTTALLRYEGNLSSVTFCERLLERTGVLLTPGSAMEMEGYLRIGYANGPEVLRAGLEQLSRFLHEAPAGEQGPALEAGVRS
jgi:aspartate/methionine/tyrosine aminotransferase